MIKDYFMISFSHVRTRRLRAYLTILGIVIGIAAIVALITISQGLENAIVDQFSKRGVNDVRVIPKGLRGPPSASNLLTTKDMDIVKNVVGVDYVIGPILSSSTVEYGNEKKFSFIAMYPADLVPRLFEDQDLKVEEGRIFKSGEKDSVIIGKKVAKDLFSKEIKLRSNLIINGKKFRVIGILEETGLTEIDSFVIIPEETGRELFNKPKEVSAILAHFKPGVDLDKAAADIKSKLKRARHNENFDVLTPKEILNQLNTILGIIQIVLGGIAGISLVVGGVGIMNAMFTSVIERTSEIGIMKAIGAQNKDILYMFLIESGFMGILGGLIGVILGTLVGFLFGKIASQLGFGLLLIKIEWGLLVFALLFAFVVGVASGTLPAVRAARLKPVDALRYE
jgi:putative ABC transport system permease protein